MRKNTKKTNTRKLSRKGAAEKDTTKKESRESTVRSLEMDQIGGKTLALGLTIEGLSTVELIKGIQKAEGNFDCFGTAYMAIAINGNATGVLSAFHKPSNLTLSFN